MNAGKLSFYSELLALLWTWIEELVLTELIGTHAEGQELTVQGQQNFQCRLSYRSQVETPVVKPLHLAARLIAAAAPRVFARNRRVDMRLPPNL